MTSGETARSTMAAWSRQFLQWPGRFAMFAAIGIIAAENETGLDAVEQILGI